MNRSSQRGSAILFLFIAVALFGAIGYAFLQGSRTSTTMITSEAGKAAGYKSQDCSNAVNMAAKRLQTRGCTVAQISSDTTGAVGSGPTDGSCAIFHPNGGGVKGACGAAPPPTDPCTTGAIGTTCTSDNAVYIGTAGGNRIYVRHADSISMSQFASGYASTPQSTTDGLANTTTLLTNPGGYTYNAASLCNSHGAGIWYLPAKDELNLLWTNRVAINLSSIGVDTTSRWYWTSTQDGGDNTAAWAQWFVNGGQNVMVKTAGAQAVRCVRR